MGSGTDVAYFSDVNDKRRIANASATLRRIDLPEPRGDAIQSFTALEVVVVEILDSTGTRGTGFATTIGKGGTTILELLRTELLPTLHGKDSQRIARIHKDLSASIHALLPGCLATSALAAIDIALWDLAARRASLPLYEYLGGACDSVPVYNTHVGWLSRPVDELVAMCDEAVNHGGFRAVKLKIGKPFIEEDLERVARVREKIGARAVLLLDANQSWSIDEALRRVPRFEPYGPGWIEEPLLATDLSGLRQLTRHTSIPIAGGESLYDAKYFYEAVACKALQILQPDIVRIGGITPALAVCGLAQAAGLKISPHVFPELSISLAAAIPHSVFIEYIPQLEADLISTLRIEEGRAYPFDTCGHGIELRRDDHEPNE